MNNYGQQQQPPLMTQDQYAYLQQIQAALNTGYMMSPQEQQEYKNLLDLFNYTKQVESQRTQQQPRNNIGVSQFNQQGNQGGWPQQQQQQRPMYQNNSYSRPRARPNGYINNGGMANTGTSPFLASAGNMGNNVTATKTNNNRFSSNRYVPLDYVDGNEPVAGPALVEAEPVIDVDSLIPLEGHEYPPLTLPTQTCIKEAKGDYYIYKVIEKGNKVDYNEHASVYSKANLIVKANIGKTDDKQLKIIDGGNVNVVYNSNDIVPEMEFIINENDAVYDTVAAEFVVVSKYMVAKTTTDATDLMFATIVNDSNSLEVIAEAIKAKMESKNTLTSKAFTNINTTLTKMVNLALRSTLGSKLALESFVEDISELFEEISSMIEVNVKNRYNAAMTDIFNTLKADALELKDYLPNEEDLSGNKIGPMYYSSKRTIIYTSNMDIKYELMDVENNKVEFIKDALTPLIEDLIHNVVNESDFNRTNHIILYTDNGKRFRIIKTKLNNSYTIEKI